MKQLFLSLLCLVWWTAALAQKQANIWYFGQFAGLEFNTNCQPTALLDNDSNADGGSAVMADGSTGQLLFYTNGLSIWNRQHQLMPTGNFRSYGGYSFPTQGSLIVPAPQSPHQYYLFRLAEDRTTQANPTYNARLSYSLIDMRLEGGLGDVVQPGKDSVLAQGLAARLTAVPHANGRDYWILTHQWGSDAFLVYPLTAAGVGRADTIRIGSVFSIPELTGFLKASPDGRRVAVSSTSTRARPFELFDFDASTGRLTNYANLGNLRLQYGVSFSPDNTKLYVTNQNILDDQQNAELIRQYDLTAGSVADIIASAKSIIYLNPFTNLASLTQGNQAAHNGFYAPSLQLGPDGRLYVAADYSTSSEARECPNCDQHLLVINQPNERGFACDVQLQVTELGKGLVGDSNDFPNFMQHYFNGLTPQDCPFDRNAVCTDANVRLWPNPASDQMQILVTDLCFTPYQLRIINELGQVLASHHVTSPLSQRVDVSRLAGGSYLAELRLRNQTVVKRFVRY